VASSTECTVGSSSFLGRDVYGVLDVVLDLDDLAFMWRRRRLEIIVADLAISRRPDLRRRHRF